MHDSRWPSRKTIRFRPADVEHSPQMLRKTPPITTRETASAQITRFIHPVYYLRYLHSQVHSQPIVKSAIRKDKPLLCDNIPAERRATPARLVQVTAGSISRRHHRFDARLSPPGRNK